MNRDFRVEVRRKGVVSSYRGLRQLLDKDEKAGSISRDYQIELDHDQCAPPLNVFGAKISTYRRLGEQAVDRLADTRGTVKLAWSEYGDPLPGGDFSAAERLVISRSQPWP